MSKGIELITKERQRQITEEGFTPLNDKQYINNELATAGALYALPPELRQLDNSFVGLPKEWPWGDNWWKPTPENRIKELTKAGALIVAEIDRLTGNDSTLFTNKKNMEKKYYLIPLNGNQPKIIINESHLDVIEMFANKTFNGVEWFYNINGYKFIIEEQKKEFTPGDIMEIVKMFNTIFNELKIKPKDLINVFDKNNK